MNRVIRTILRPIWQRRHAILRNIKMLFDWLIITLDKIPLPAKLKLLIKDLTFFALLHLIVHTNRFQAWRNNQGGTAALQYILTQSAEDEVEYVPHIPAPTAAQWQKLKDIAQPINTTIDVIIPVYSGYEQSLNAIYCALATRQHNHIPYNVIVIDDASPDPALSAALRQFGADGLFELYVNAQNLGFVETVNKGMMLNPANDVLLLNADTEVYNNWLDKMVKSARTDASIATVTPLSNNAEICSYPYFVQNNQRELEIDYAHIDAIAAKVNEGVMVDVPTGVGFCMYISRASITDVGLFDVVHFGKGYGEENDFCMRALAKGWRNVAIADTFVRHIGGTSFGKSKQKRCRKAYEVLVGLHPHYPKLVQSFIAKDSLRLHRQAIDIERIILANGGNQSILMINHQMGGGTERHVRELSLNLQEQQIGHIVLEPSYLGAGMVVLKHYSAINTANLVFSMEYDREALIDCLRRLNIFHIHIHHLVNFPARITNLLNVIRRELNLQYDVTLHDYFSICPRINLIDDDNEYCGEPVVSGCETCIQRNHSHAAGASVWQWRDNYATLLMAARKVFAPNADVAERINRYYGGVQIDVRPHSETFDVESFNEAKITRNNAPNDRLKVGVVGAISGFKGSKILKQLVDDANAHNLAIEYVVIGYTDRSDLHEGVERFSVTGKYEEHQVGELIAKHNPDMIFIPTPIPETYSYTLSTAWRFGVIPVVFDIGAQAERVRAAGADAGLIAPLELAQNAAKLNDWLLKAKLVAPQSLPKSIEYHNLIADYYQLVDALVKIA